MTEGRDNKSVERLLALYCDDALEPKDRAEFDRMMAADPSLRAEIELQRRIDASLRHAFDAANLAESGPLPMKASRSRVIWRVAAVLLLALSIGVVYRQYMIEFGRGPGSNTAAILATTMQAYYDDAVAGGFEPGWVCSKEQFASTFEGQFGQRIVMDNLPDRIQLSGLGYARIRSMQTVSVFVRVDNKPVLLFVEPATATGDLSPMNAGTYRHERAYGNMLIYEVSPFSEPQILDFISVAKCNGRQGD